MLVLSNSPSETQVELQVPEDLETEVTMVGFFFSPFCWPFHFQLQNILINYKFNFKKKLKGKFCTFGLENPHHFPEAINGN